MEIQIEGKHGFAGKLPTWKYNWAWYKALSNGKVLTGYHVYLNLLLMFFFHFPFVFTPWTLQRELLIAASFMLYVPTWDFLWFVLNPAYGWKRFLKKKIHWFTNWHGPFPYDYYFNLAGSFFVVALLPIFSAYETHGTLLQDSAQTLLAWILSAVLFIALPITALILLRLREERQSWMAMLRTKVFG